MENNERDRKLDQWLDEALSEYSVAEPRFGLEQRVLNRIRGEEQHSRKWTFWRWMPAFGAIAAIVVVAVAITPVLVKKTPLPQQQERTATVLQHDKAKSAEPEPLSRDAKVVKPAEEKVLVAGDTRGSENSRTNAVRAQKPESSQGSDRDKLVSSQTGSINGQLRDPRSFRTYSAGTAGNEGTASALAAVAPPPPPPAQVQPDAVGGVLGEVAASAPQTAPTTAPIHANGSELKARTETVEVQTNEPVLLSDKVATQSVTSVLAKDERRKEAHAKPEPSRQDPNTMEAFGVTVRFQSGPATQQFPTPVPLSNQEKLALKAARELKDSAVAQHKSTEIKPIEIENVEIKPLEGSEKDK